MAMVELYDTTLRDGAQAEGVSFSIEDKLRITLELDKLGVHYIEGGYAGANPKDEEFFERARKLKLKNSKLTAFGSTRRPNRIAREDRNIHHLLEAGTEAVTIVGKSWDIHVTDVIGTELEENLAMIEDSVRSLKENGREVIFDAEHYFDGYIASPEYALKTIEAAARGGANRIVLCETRGGMLPLELKEIFEIASAKVHVPLGIHAHNDSGMAAANSIVAVQSGAVQVHGTINGYGERCGNADLCTIAPNLKLKLGIDCISNDALAKLTGISRLVSELANLPHDERLPYVGKSAFGHKGGLHTDAVQKNAITYEHVEPESVGNERRILVSDQSGRSTVLMKLMHDHPDFEKDSPVVQQIFNELKESESNGYQYEGAEGSFELMMQRIINGDEKFFNLHGFTVLVDRFENNTMRSQATIKLVDAEGNVEYQASEGHGPVDALSKALRKALRAFFPQLDAVHLTDFKVRVLNAKSGTAAKVRVLIESSDGEEDWGTVGVSEDIIEASWEALVESIEYKLFKDKQRGK